jgi:hypothetical protein
LLSIQTLTNRKTYKDIWSINASIYERLISNCAID